MSKTVNLIDGKKLAEERGVTLKRHTKMLFEDYCLQPTLAIVRVGDDFASGKYIQSKKNKAIEYGILANTYEYDEDITEERLLTAIDFLNRDENVHGILVQLPLPSHIDTNTVLNAINPIKDVDGFHPVNIGKLHSGQDTSGVTPCTAKGVIELIKSTGESIEGKRAVVIGRSNIVGRPVASLLEKENATVTLCHSKTDRVIMTLAMREADIVVSAVGIPEFISKGMLGFNQIIIDVGINRDKDGKLCGDVDFENASVFAKHITPVPGGVGPMTISCLMENTILCAMNQTGIYEDITFDIE